MALNIRSLLRKHYLTMAGPFSRFSNDIFFLYGHYTSKNTINIDKAKFLIDELNKDLEFIPFDAACSLVKDRKKPKKPSVCFSFDDGFEEIVVEVAPKLIEMGGNPCIFINPGYIDSDHNKMKKMMNNNYHTNKKPASWEQLENFIKLGGFVGSHTINHIDIAQENDPRAYNEIVKSKKFIEERLSNDCKYFAWPYGTAKNISDYGLSAALEHYEYVFSAIRSKDRFFKFDRVINRDHFELDWNLGDIRYFLSKQKKINI